MHTRVFQDGSVSLTDAIDTVSAASLRLAGEDVRMSQHEFNAAAIVNGRLDLLDRDSGSNSSRWGVIEPTPSSSRFSRTGTKR